MRPILFTVMVFVHFLLFPSESSQSPPVLWDPLSNYIEPKLQNNLDIFLGGSAIFDHVPILFSIPCMHISAVNPQVKICTKNLTIPMSVGWRLEQVMVDCWEACEWEYQLQRYVELKNHKSSQRDHLMLWVPLWGQVIWHWFCPIEQVFDIQFWTKQWEEMGHYLSWIEQ